MNFHRKPIYLNNYKFLSTCSKNEQITEEFF